MQTLVSLPGGIGTQARPASDPSPSDGGRLDRRAYAAVREALMSGRLKPGQAIKLRDLAGILGVSRQPVHAALRRLEAEGALVASPTSGTLSVPFLSAEDVEEIREIRVQLEGLAARKAAGFVAADGIEPIRERCEALEARAEAFDLEGFTAANWAFHHAVYAASRSPMLLAAIEPFWLRIGPYVEFMMRDREALLASLPAHWEAVEALRRGDGAAAEAAIVGDLNASAAMLAAHLRSAPPPPGGRAR